MQLFSEWSGVNSRIMVSGGWPPVSLPDGRGSQGGRRLPEGGMPVLDREVIGATVDCWPWRLLILCAGRGG